MTIIDEISKRYYIYLSGFVFIVALLVRVYNLGNESLWVDEAVYANNSHGDFKGFIENTRLHNSCPILLPYLYYIFDDFLRDAFFVRIFPAIFGSLTVGCVLMLPSVGISYVVCLVSALWMAILPVQIEYSQEVREYSLSSLITCILLLAFFCQLKYKNKQSLSFLIAIIFLTPFCSYGACFMMLSVAGIYFLNGLFKKLITIAEASVLIVAMLSALLLSYLLTAKYQFQVGQSWYLVDYYPPTGFIASIKWLIHSVFGYIEYATGGYLLGRLSLIVFGAYFVVFLFRKAGRIEKNFIFILLLLIFGLIISSFLRLYPFGGIRQQVFASPLVIICVVACSLLLSEKFKINNVVFALVFASGLSLYLIPKIPSAYQEKEDILSAVNQGLYSVDDKDVYVYYGAQPAALFHYPNRKFYLGQANRGEIQYMASEIYSRMTGCELYLLFSHIFKTEKSDVIGQLTKYGVLLVTEDNFVGANVIKISRCN